jgi:hypothetical protein
MPPMFVFIAQIGEVLAKNDVKPTELAVESALRDADGDQDGAVSYCDLLALSDGQKSEDELLSLFARRLRDANTCD